MLQIIPGILEKDWNEIEKKLEIVKSFTKSAHIDILDGKFAPGTTFLDPKPFSKYSQELFLEVHMMVENPIWYLESFAKAGFKRFIGHIEKMPDQAEFVAKAETLGEVGIAIDGPTELSEIKVPYEDLDCVLIMTIKAGESGQIFNPECLKKIEAIYSVTKDIGVEVDGGINDETILLARDAGVSRFVSTSFIFCNDLSINPTPQAQFNLLNAAIAGEQKNEKVN
jgi:ribulose-phosphate 3-epimerase